MIKGNEMTAHVGKYMPAQIQKIIDITSAISLWLDLLLDIILSYFSPDGYAGLRQKKCESLDGKSWPTYRDSQNDDCISAIPKAYLKPFLMSIGRLTQEALWMVN